MSVQKCGFDGNSMVYCEAMARYARDSGDGYKGVFLVQTISDDGDFRDIGLRMKNGVKDNGVMLNACPFCLSDIKGWERERILAPQPSKSPSTER